MNWIEMCQDEALKSGVTLTDDQADHVLWEFTGFPYWYEGDSAEAHFRKQISEHLS